MSDTPRTDALLESWPSIESATYALRVQCLAYHAKILERELAELQRKFDNLKHESDMRGSY